MLIIFLIILWQAELTFSAGDIIHVFGDMDEDGFFYVSVNRTLKFGGVFFFSIISDKQLFLYCASLK